MNFKKRNFLFVLLVICLFISIFFSNSTAAEKPIKIGAIWPLSGRPAFFGIDSVAAAEIAVDEINEKGGVLGRKFELLVTDSEANPQTSTRIFERYIRQEQVDFLMGVVSSAVALAVTEVSKRYEKIFVITDASSPALTYDKGHSYVFRTADNSYQANGAAALLAQYKPWKKYAVIGADYEGPHQVWENFWEPLQKYRPDVELVNEQWPKLGEPDYGTYLTAIIASKPDVLFMALWGGDAVACINQAASLGLFDKMEFMATEIGGDYGVLSRIDPNTLPEGCMMSARYSPYFPDTEFNRSFVEKFYNKTGHYPAYAAEGAYVGIHMLAKAIEEAGTVEDTQKLIETLENIEIQQPGDPDGYISKMNPVTHQLSCVCGIGFTTKSDEYPPATVILDNFFSIIGPEPSDEEVMALRNR